MLGLAPLILRNVTRNRRRSLLTLASTAISLAILGLMVTIYQGFFQAEDVSPAGALRLITRHRVALVQPLLASQQEQIRNVPGVEQVAAYSWFQGKYKDDKPENQFARFAVDPENIFEIFTDFNVPPEQLAAFKRGRTSCALAKAIADHLHIKLGDTMIIKGDIYPVDLELKVDAIFTHPKNTDVMFFHRAYLTELLPKDNEQRNMVGTYIIRADKVSSMNRICDEIDNHLFKNGPYPTRTESEKAFSASFVAFLGNLKLYLAMICGAVTFTIMLVSANAISMSVRERTRDTAIMRTLGYKPGEILLMIVGEAVTVSVVGGLIGLGLAFVMLKGGGGGGFPLPDLRLEGALIVMGIAIFVGVLSSAVPAFITSRKNIVESLRFTG